MTLIAVLDPTRSRKLEKPKSPMSLCSPASASVSDGWLTKRPDAHEAGGGICLSGVSSLNPKPGLNAIPPPGFIIASVTSTVNVQDQRPRRQNASGSPPAMSSSPPGFSLPGDAGSGRRSRFTYRHLAQLAACNPSSPLRVIAHIDLDAFYAQCEMVRLGVPDDRPLAVQQWQGLIAVNYAAREAGIGRHCNVSEAKQLCPDLIAQHVATWREGDDKWAYRDDAAANMVSDKVSLDPYRLQSRRILALVEQLLPADQHKVEKASIDEVFVDLSAHVHAVLRDRFPELCNSAPCNHAADQLPFPSVAALD